MNMAAHIGAIVVEDYPSADEDRAIKAANPSATEFEVRSHGAWPYQL